MAEFPLIKIHVGGDFSLSLVEKMLTSAVQSLSAT